MQNEYKAVIKRDGQWWIGGIQEIPGVNSQGKTRKELVANLHSALTEAIELNRSEAKAAVEGSYEEESIQV